MKNVFLATVAALGVTATAAAADELAFIGSLEHAIEADVTELVAGVEYAPTAIAGLTVTPTATFNNDAQNFDFAGVDLTVGYAVSTNVTTYVEIAADKNFSYQEATVGVAFRF